ncbi:MAG: nucleotidyltransferase [Anaerolineae bacterium]|nr:MAG: nucleotidyltransferase [Anaerolineae bacterium]
MGRVKERLREARKALETLERVVGLSSPSEVERDAAIQRFEYTFELTWKATQAYLFEHEFIEVASPRKAIRASLESGLFDEAAAQKLMAAAQDRNLTVHTYNEALAIQVYERLAGHASLLRAWLDAIQERVT